MELGSKEWNDWYEREAERDLYDETPIYTNYTERDEYDEEQDY